mgnify:CR=1 FL=1
MNENEKHLFNKEESHLKAISNIVLKHKRKGIIFFNNKTLLLLILLIICLVEFLIIIILSFNQTKENNKTNINKFRKIYDMPKPLFLYKEDINNSINYNKSEILISMALDNGGIYPTLVSMTSALENNDKKNNILVYYILLSHDFNVSKIEIFESLKSKYELKINYYIIPNIFESGRQWGNTYTVYYKLLLPLMFPEFERIIFLDGDTLIFKDILEMYSLPFNNNYVLGYPFHSPWLVDHLGIYSIYYINGGILMLNIKEIRRANADIKLLEYTMNNFDKVKFLEQDTINYIFFNKIGLLPLKYGVYLFGDFNEFKKEYLYKFRFKLNLTEMKEAINDPSIVHLCCCNPKVWYKKTKHENHFNHICKRFQKERCCWCRSVKNTKYRLCS